jgi:phage terminase small subunit
MRTFEDVPILKNERHELFCQKLAEGRSATEAYVLGGFKSSRKNASRLRAKEDIAARVSEIQAAGAKSAEVSVGSLLAELEEARAKAADLNQSVICCCQGNL